MRNLVKTFKALSDPNRIRILKMLEVRPLCVCEIRDILQLANSTVSKHLSLLRDVEFILDEKDGKWVNFRLNDEQYNQYVSKLLPLIAEWLPDEAAIKRDREKVKQVDRYMTCAS